MTLNSDQQLGQEDTIISDHETWALVKDWLELDEQYKALDAYTLDKARKDAKGRVVEKLTLDSSRKERFRFVVEDEENIYIVDAAPPSEPETKRKARTQKNNHRLKVGAVE